MSARHPVVLRWEEDLKKAFDEIDHALEARYGDQYPLRPSRPAQGTTANPEDDGLFNVGASFTPGYGSKLGRGYVINVHMSTWARVPADRQELIEEEVAALLRERLPALFPGRDLRVDRDGHVFKITGDLSITSAQAKKP
jgi:glycine/D-amino acid oxidase-like deaminating enzyme